MADSENTMSPPVSRRYLLAGVGVLALTPPTSSLPPAAEPDPIITLYQRRRALDRVVDKADKAIDRCVAELVASGHPRLNDYSFDPDFLAAWAEYDRLGFELDAIDKEICATRACTFQGALAKLEMWAARMDKAELPDSYCGLSVPKDFRALIHGQLPKSMVNRGKKLERIFLLKSTL